MDNLQRLLEARFPANGDLAHDSKMLFLRDIFTEGYNAAMGRVKEIAGSAMSKGWHLGWEDRDKNESTYDAYGNANEFINWFDKISSNG